MGSAHDVYTFFKSNFQGRSQVEMGNPPEVRKKA